MGYAQKLSCNSDLPLFPPKTCKLFFNLLSFPYKTYSLITISYVDINVNLLTYKSICFTFLIWIKKQSSFCIKFYARQRLQKKVLTYLLLFE